MSSLSLHLSLLGPIQITLDDTRVIITSPKIQALLAYLVMEPRSHSREALADLLWPEQETGRQNLRQSLSRLQTALPQSPQKAPRFHATRQEIGFRPSSGVILDVEIFRRKLAEARQHPHPDPVACEACAQTLTAALALYRGDFLAGLAAESRPFEEWAERLREQLRGEAGRALSQLTQRHSQGAEWPIAETFARRHIALAPLDEAAHRNLMTILAGQGRHAEAVAHYDYLSDLLADELDISPAPETSALYQKLRDVPALPPVTGAPTYPLAPKHNLPPQFTPFIGREADLAQINQRLDQPECRLLTLLGPGGVGKSRLAVQVGHARRDAHPDGVWFVPLAELTPGEQAGEQAVDAIADAVGEAISLLFGSRAVTGTDRRRALLQALKRRQMLLILDNMEHLLPDEDLLGLVVDLLQGCEGVALLVTSRRPLDLRAEWLWDVAGLPFPPPEEAEDAPGQGPNGQAAARPLTAYPAVQLFVQSAQRLRPDFRLEDGTNSPENAAPVGRICALVGGLPLALELAAAGIRSREVAQIAQEIERDVDSLQTAMRDVPARHRSLRAVFQNSWAQLAPAEQAAFRRLAVFHGSFSQAAAEEVAQIPAPTLERFCQRSLLRREQTALEPHRFILHESLRPFVQERLADAPDAVKIHAAHSRFYTRLLGQSVIPDGGDGPLTPAQLRPEMDNVRAAWAYAVAQADLSALGQGSGGLLRYFVLTNRAEEGERIFGQAVERVAQSLAPLEAAHPVAVAALAELMACHARMLFKLARYDQAGAVAEAAMGLGRQANAPRPTSQATLYAGLIALYQNREEAAQALFEQALQMARQHDLLKVESDALRSLGIIHDQRADLVRADFYYSASLDISQRIGDRRGASASLGNLGVIRQRRGDLAKARTLLEAALEIHRAIGDRSSAGRTLTYLGELAEAQGDLADAESYLVQGATLLRQIQDRHHEAESLVALGRLMTQAGRPDDAQTALDRAMAFYREIGDEAGIAEIRAVQNGG